MFGNNKQPPLRSVEVDLRQKEATHELNDAGKIVDAGGKQIGGKGFNDAMNFNGRLSALESAETAKSMVLSKMNQKIQALHGFQRSVLMFCKDLDTRLDIMLELLIEKEITTESEFEAIHDRKRGIRLRDDDEKIAKDDIVWIDYVATIVGNPKPLSENQIPVRLGLGAIAFESELIGKTPNTAGIRCTKKFEDKNFPEFLGKTVHFRINIGKVKTHRPKGEVDDKSDSGQPASTSAEASPPDQDNG